MNCLLVRSKLPCIYLIDLHFNTNMKVPWSLIVIAVAAVYYYCMFGPTEDVESCVMVSKGKSPYCLNDCIQRLRLCNGKAEAEGCLSTCYKQCFSCGDLMSF